MKFKLLLCVHVYLVLDEQRVVSIEKSFLLKDKQTGFYGKSIPFFLQVNFGHFFGKIVYSSTILISIPIPNSFKHEEKYL